MTTDRPEDSANLPYSHGRNPNTLNNLKPRSTIYEEKKRDRRLTVTDAGWAGCKALAAKLGLSGVSEMLEKMGRSELDISEKKEK